jgi:hypothetical protein
MTVDTLTVLNRMYADRRIYCIQPWCVQGGKLTPAQLFIGLDGEPRVPACRDCARRWQLQEPQPVELWYLGEDLRRHWWASIDGAIGSGPPPVTPPRSPAAVPAGSAPSRKADYAPAGMIMIASSVLFITGLAVAIMSTAPGPGIWLAILAGLGFFAGFFLLVREAEAPYRAWKTTLSTDDRRKVELGEAAAAVAATAAVAYDIHRRHERGRERLAAGNAAAAQQQRDAAQQQILGQLQQLNAPSGPTPGLALIRAQQLGGWPAPPDQSHFPNYRG